MAATHDGTAIGVVLTGTGSDGSIGLRHIKERCGLTIAQDPLEAEFDSMPRSAIATGTVDMVLRSSESARPFCNSAPPGTQLPAPAQMEAHEAVWLDQILGILRQRTQQDFDVYRRATVLRRLQRRMKLHQVTTLAAYFQFLTQQPQEAEAVANDLHLIPPSSSPTSPSSRSYRTGFSPKSWRAKPTPTAACVSVDRLRDR